MLRGHSLSIYARFSGKKRTSMYISRQAIIITSNHATTIFFSHYHLFLEKLTRKIGPKSVRKY